MNKNKKTIDVTNLTLEKKSTHKKKSDTGKEIHMYIATFKLGNRVHSQTKHMTEAQANEFVPRVETVYSGQRLLQRCSYDVKEQNVNAAK